MLPPKFGHTSGCLAFSEYLVAKKRDTTPGKSIFKNTMVIRVFLDYGLYINYVITSRGKGSFGQNVTNHDSFEEGKILKI